MLYILVIMYTTKIFYFPYKGMQFMIKGKFCFSSKDNTSYLYGVLFKWLAWHGCPSDKITFLYDFDTVTVQKISVCLDLPNHIHSIHNLNFFANTVEKDQHSSCFNYFGIDSLKYFLKRYHCIYTLDVL